MHPPLFWMKTSLQSYNLGSYRQQNKRTFEMETDFVPASLVVKQEKIDLGYGDKTTVEVTITESGDNIIVKTEVKTEKETVDESDSEEGEVSDTEGEPEEDHLANVMVKEEKVDQEEGELSEEEPVVNIKKEPGTEESSTTGVRFNGVVDLDKVETEVRSDKEYTSQSEQEPEDIDYECSDDDVPDSRFRFSYMLGHFLQELTNGDFSRRRKKHAKKEDVYNMKMEAFKRRREAKKRKKMAIKQEEIDNVLHLWLTIGNYTYQTGNGSRGQLQNISTKATNSRSCNL